MLISGMDSFQLWVDGVEQRDLKYADVWSYPDRVEVRGDTRMLAVQVNTFVQPSVAHAFIVFSQSGKFDTSRFRSWRCKEHLESFETPNWFRPGFIKPHEWPASVVIAPNSNFRSQLNLWPGPVRLLPPEAMWVSSWSFSSKFSHCIRYLS